MAPTGVPSEWSWSWWMRLFSTAAESRGSSDLPWRDEETCIVWLVKVFCILCPCTGSMDHRISDSASKHQASPLCEYNKNIHLIKSTFHSMFLDRANLVPANNKRWKATSKHKNDCNNNFGNILRKYYFSVPNVPCWQHWATTTTTTTNSFGQMMDFCSLGLDGTWLGWWMTGWDWLRRLAVMGMEMMNRYRFADIDVACTVASTTTYLVRLGRSKAFGMLLDYSWWFGRVLDED